MALRAVASAPPSARADAEIAVCGDPGAIAGKSCAPSSNGIARGGQSGPIYSGMPEAQIIADY